MINSTTQHRHYLNTPQQQADLAYAMLEAEFDEDGIPVSLFEIDEPNGIWCVCIYVNAEASQALKARMTTVLVKNRVNAEIKTEIISETDWVSKTLGQLVPVRAGRFLVHGTQSTC
jgi:ribosomal protein L11 methyltransferase